MGEFQPSEFFFFALEIELFLCNCKIKMHKIFSSFTVLFYHIYMEKARYKFLTIFLIIIIVIIIIIIIIKNAYNYYYYYY